MGCKFRHQNSSEGGRLQTFSRYLLEQIREILKTLSICRCFHLNFSNISACLPAVPFILLVNSGHLIGLPYINRVQIYVELSLNRLIYEKNRQHVLLCRETSYLFKNHMSMVSNIFIPINAHWNVEWMMIV